MTSTTSVACIAKLKDIFARFGIPLEVVSDNGPQFASTEFRSFAAKYDFLHVTTSPFLPNANGEAERAVQSAKRILQQEDPWLSLLIYRDTVIAAAGYIPAQLMLGRHVRTTLPTLPSSLMPHWPNPDDVRQKDQETKSSYSHDYDRRHGVRFLPSLAQAILSECGQVNRPFGVRRAQWLPRLTHHVRTWSRQIWVSIGVAGVIYRRLGRPSLSHLDLLGERHPRIHQMS